MGYPPEITLRSDAGGPVLVGRPVLVGAPVGYVPAVSLTTVVRVRPGP